MGGDPYLWQFLCSALCINMLVTWAMLVMEMVLACGGEPVLDLEMRQDDRLLRGLARRDHPEGDLEGPK